MSSSGLLLLILWLSSAQNANGDESKTGNDSPDKTSEVAAVKMRTGGIARYLPFRWGMIRGRVQNDSNQPATSLTVVTPAGSGGLQFARQLTLPAEVAFDAMWPVFVPEATASGGVDFQYLFFPNGVDDGVIRIEAGSKEIPSFHGIASLDRRPMCGIVGDSGPRQDEDRFVTALLATMRYSSVGNRSVVSIGAADLTADSECLDALDQMAVTDPELCHFPLACAAIRAWVLRGGRLMIVADRTGPAVVEALLGDSLPITFVGETTTNSLTLEINPDYPASQYPDRSVAREYPEPVRFLRVVPEKCEQIWSVDGWPVAMTKAIGRGSVLVTTISSGVFTDPVQNPAETAPPVRLINSGRRLLEVLFSKRSVPLIAETTVADQAAGSIGYRIPSRFVAASLLAIFPAGILIIGLILLRRGSGERLIVAVPVLAVVAVLPASVIGYQIRNVAPPTVIESVVVSSSPGFTELPADGFASVFTPSPRDLGVSADKGTRLSTLADSTNADYRRMTWHGPGQVTWGSFLQPAGLRTYPLNSAIRLSKPWRIPATFDESGLVGTLPSGDGVKPRSAILAGMNRENLALDSEEDGAFSATPDNALPAGQFFQSTLLSDDERYRTSLLSSVFGAANGSDQAVFPEEPSVVFWDESETGTLHFEGDDVRQQRSVLVVHPLELYPPEIGKSFLIPPQLISYRSVKTEDGGISSSYSNMNRKWQPQELSSRTMLEFKIPEACRPFASEFCEMQLLIRAGSRVVTLKSGSRENLQTIAEFRSPLGLQTISIPGELIASTCSQGYLLVQIDVGDVDSEMKADDMTGEQDDSWQIERVLLTLKGQRKL